MRKLLLDGFNEAWVAVSREERAKPHTEIDVVVAVNVQHMRALS